MSLSPLRKERGFVVGRTEKERQALKDKRLALTLAQRRSCLTLVGFIADTLEFQKMLPQFIIGNEHVLPAAFVSRFPQGAGNVYMIRRKSSWVSKKLLIFMLRRVAVALRRTSLSPYIILSMDTCPVHLAPEVFRAAAQAKLHVHLVPAQMTRFLQPLDILVFAEFKRCLAEKYHEAIVDSPSGKVHRHAFLNILVDVVKHVLFKDWGRAFRRSGWGPDRTEVSQTLLRALEVDSILPIEPTLPCLNELQLIFPRRRVVPVVDCFRLLLRKPLLKRTRALRGAPSEESTLSLPLRKRLRSGRLLRAEMRAQKLKHTAAASSSSGAPAPPPCPPPPLPQPQPPQPHHLQRLPRGRPLFSRRLPPTAAQEPRL